MLMGTDARRRNHEHGFLLEYMRTAARVQLLGAAGAAAQCADSYKSALVKFATA